MMKQIHAFETKTDYEKYEAVTHRFQARLDEYQTILQETYKLIDVPKGIVWTSAELATTVFSDIPIPAFTNKDLIYISPDVAEWRTLFLSQLDGKDVPHIRAFYETLAEDHVLTIAGHELTHHLDLFVDEFDDEREDGIWFEEGMCEYLPRKHLLSDEAFKRITTIETELVELFQEEYGAPRLINLGLPPILVVCRVSCLIIGGAFWQSTISSKSGMTGTSYAFLKHIGTGMNRGGLCRSRHTLIFRR